MSFNELENKAKELAKEILEGKKILLSFPRGTGKTTFGIILAKEILKQTKENKMNKIKFSSDYPKLHGQQKATLVAVARIKINKNTPQELLEYDTKKSDGTYYELKSGTYMQLIFLGDKSIPFCTIRSAYPTHKVEYYKSSIGKVFDIVIEEQKPDV